MASVKDLAGGLLDSFRSLGHPTLPPEQVAVARLLALTWLLTGHVTWAPGVHVPWLSWLSFAEGRELWSFVQTASGFSAALVILFSAEVRAGAAWLAFTILMGLASSRAEFGYNRLFVASLLLAIGAATGWGRVLPRLQVAVLYFGAGFDKLLDSDWRSGVFLSSFVEELARFGRLWSPGGFVGRPNLVAQLAWNTLPRSAFAGASWVVILTELGLAAAFSMGSRRAVIPAVCLHVGIALLTGGTFGMFFFAGLASVLLVTGIPERTGEATDRAPFDVRWLLSWPGLAVVATVSSLPWWTPILALIVPVLMVGALFSGRPAHRTGEGVEFTAG